MFDFRVGVGVGLEVGEVAPHPGNRLATVCELPVHTAGALLAERIDATEAAAAPADGAVAVGAGEPGVQGQFVHAFAKTVFQVAAQGVNVMVKLHPVVP